MMNGVNWAEYNPLENAPDGFDKEARKLQVFGIGIVVDRLRSQRRRTNREGEKQRDCHNGNSHWKSSSRLMESRTRCRIISQNNNDPGSVARGVASSYCAALETTNPLIGYIPQTASPEQKQPAASDGVGVGKANARGLSDD